MANHDHETQNGNRWEEWSREQRLRVTAALDLYIYYLLKNLDQHDVFDVSLPADNEQIVPVLLERARISEDLTTTQNRENGHVNLPHP